MPEEFYIVEEECLACGTCAELCSGCFKFEDDMENAKVISFDCPEDDVQDAMDNCPAECIYWTED